MDPPQRHRIAVVTNADHHPTNCQCLRHCPVVRMGKLNAAAWTAEAVARHPNAVVPDYLCIGCGICVVKCKGVTLIDW